MPNIKSAKKRVKVIATKTLQNKTINSRLKTEIKRAMPPREQRGEQGGSGQGRHQADRPGCCQGGPP